jgi:lambda family phage portal protein
MNHLFAGEDSETVKSERPSGDYGPFVAAQMRGVAAGTGNSYEQLSMDYSQSNYSSIRAVMNEVWRSILVERDNLAFSLATPMFALWFEEMVNQNPDWLPAGAPGFYVNRDAYLHARWIGPGRGHVDPDKESRGQGRRLENGVETVMAQYAADGRDPEEAREELLEEVEFYNSKGWVHPSQAEQMNNPGQPVTQETEFPENEQEDEDQ